MSTSHWAKPRLTTQLRQRLEDLLRQADAVPRPGSVRSVTLALRRVGSGQAYGLELGHLGFDLNGLGTLVVVVTFHRTSTSTPPGPS